MYYYFADMLGSSNVVATSAGALENESDFYPFGGELAATQNLTDQHYKFEGKERDTETGLDNFGARFDSSTVGRFMSPDWAASAEPVPYAKLSSPQTLNLYAFAQNNPESAPDLDGHQQQISLPLDFENESGADDTDAYQSDAGVAQRLFVTGQSIADMFNQADGFANSLAAAFALPPQQKTASVVFGETSGLTSEVDKNGKPVVTPGADPNLDTARENVADVSKRNSSVYSHTPTADELKNPQVKAAWEASQAAAKNSDGSLPGKYFFIRQEGVGKQRPSKRAGYGQGTPIKSYGPFSNTGGGDVPRGSRTYIDIYDK